MYEDKDLEWTGLIAYARGAGAMGYDEAAGWVRMALVRGFDYAYDRPPVDMAMAYRRVDEIAARVASQ